MDVKAKRHIASWVLLAVFVPMLFFSSLHIHHQQQTTEETCAECIHHHCGGHLGQQSASFHPCVLCQFLSLPMLAVAIAMVVSLYKKCKTEHVAWRRSVCVAHIGVIGLRAPPVCLL